MAWLWLVLGGAFEIAFTTCLRNVEGFRHLGWTAGFLVCAMLSMALLEMAARTIPMGTAYAIWTGIGALGTVAIGIALYGEPLGVVRALLILGVVACIAGLKLTAA